MWNPSIFFIVKKQTCTFNKCLNGFLRKTITWWQSTLRVQSKHHFPHNVPLITFLSILPAIGDALKSILKALNNVYLVVPESWVHELRLPLHQAQPHPQKRYLYLLKLATTSELFNLNRTWINWALVRRWDGRRWALIVEFVKQSALAKQKQG